MRMLYIFPFLEPNWPTPTFNFRFWSVFSLGRNATRACYFCFKLCLGCKMHLDLQFRQAKMTSLSIWTGNYKGLIKKSKGKNAQTPCSSENAGKPPLFCKLTKKPLCYDKCCKIHIFYLDFKIELLYKIIISWYNTYSINHQIKNMLQKLSVTEKDIKFGNFVFQWGEFAAFMMIRRV